MDCLKGDKVNLRPATPGDREDIFQWLTNSNLTRDMLGPPDFPDSSIPSREEFLIDYSEHYFSGDEPLRGQCFIIELEGNAIGQINHNRIDAVTGSTDLDIWLSDRGYTGKGYGTEAITLLCNYLNREYGCRKIRISPSARNLRAIKAYEKAGFEMTDEVPDESERDYIDNVVLVKSFKNE